MSGSSSVSSHSSPIEAGSIALVGTSSSSDASSLFFPSTYTACVHHILPVNYDEDEEALVGPHLSLSVPVRIGPLEFRIQAELEQITDTVSRDRDSDCESQEDPEIEYLHQTLTWSLLCKSLPLGFPWSGEVRAEFEILEQGRGCPTDWYYDSEKALVSSDQEERQVLSARKYIWDRPCGCGGHCFDSEDELYYLRDFLDYDNFLHVRALVRLEVGLKPGVSGGGSRSIPLTLLDQPAPATPALRLAADFPDVVLLSKEGKELPANRMILAGSSEVFQAMFLSSGMKESAEGRVKIDDIGGKALGLLLKFLYSGGLKEEIEKLEEYEIEDFMELAYTGHKYNISRLMKLAGVGLLMRVTEENMSELDSALEIYGDEMQEAKISLSKFIKTRFPSTSTSGSSQSQKVVKDR